jgi:succinyl-CoA synthetase alpha subunit
MTMMLSSARMFVQRSAQAGSRRSMSANAKVWIDKDTRVICQGFTGKQVSSFGFCSVLAAMHCNSGTLYSTCLLSPF